MAVVFSRINSGALLGELSRESVVEDCYAWGSLTSPESNAGGLIGTLDGRGSYVTVRRCYYQGTLSGGEDTGRIVSDTPSNFTLRGNYAAMRAAGWSDTVWDYGSVTADSGPRQLFIEDSLAVTVPA